MDFNNFNSGFNSSGSSRDRLEITDSGKSRGEEKEEKRKERMARNFGHSSSSRGRSFGSGDGRGKKVIGTIIFWCFVLFVLFSLNLKYNWIDLSATPLKLSQQEGLNSMLDSAKDLKEQKDVVAGVDKELPDIYKKNNIHDGASAFSQTEDEYLIYVYSGDENLDKEFNRFIKIYEKDVKIYRLGLNESRVEFSFNDNKYLENKYKPHFILIDRLDADEQVEEGYYFEDNLGSVIEDVNKLKQRQKIIDGES